jgi:hypothetical protein
MLNGSYSASTDGKLHHEKWFWKIVSRPTVCVDAKPLSTLFCLMTYPWAMAAIQSQTCRLFIL